MFLNSYKSVSNFFYKIELKHFLCTLAPKNLKSCFYKNLLNDFFVVDWQPYIKTFHMQVSLGSILAGKAPEKFKLLIRCGFSFSFVTTSIN